MFFLKKTKNKPCHAFVRFLRYCKYMGVHVSHVLPMIGTNDVSFIDRKALIGVDGNQDNSFRPHHSKTLLKTATFAQMQYRHVSIAARVCSFKS